MTAHLHRGRPQPSGPSCRSSSSAPGHAVRIALDVTGRRDARPARSWSLARRRPAAHRRDAAELLAAHDGRVTRSTVLTAVLDDPTGYGRVVRDGRRRGDRASSSRRTPTAEQRAVREINSGVYAFDAGRPARRPRPARHRQRAGRGVPHRRARPRPGRRAGRSARWRRRRLARSAGVNDRVQLAALHGELNCATGSQRAGCAPASTVVDPATTWIDVDVTLEPDSVAASRNTQLHGTHPRRRRRRGRARHHARRHRVVEGARGRAHATADRAP